MCLLLQEAEGARLGLLSSSPRRHGNRAAEMYVMFCCERAAFCFQGANENQRAKRKKKTAMHNLTISAMSMCNTLRLLIECFNVWIQAHIRENE